MKNFKRNIGMMLTGMALGAVLTGGAFAAGIMAEPAWSPIYVDGQQVQMTAYNILGNNYVKLRDIGKAVGFNVYYQNGVQVDSDAPYTGEAPVQVAVVAESSIRVGSYKGNPLKAGDRSGLIIGPSETSYTVTSSNPAVVAIENVSGNWVAVAKAGGSATITATDSNGNTGTLILTVMAEAAAPVSQTSGSSVDLNTNIDIRQEMIRRINQVRRENGMPELAINTALMNAAQEHSTHQYTDHNREECEVVLAHGYPYGFGSNLTVFTCIDPAEIPEHAVQNWVNSRGHFQTMVAPYYDSIGVGVTVADGRAYCYMFVGDPTAHNPYE